MRCMSDGSDADIFDCSYLTKSKCYHRRASPSYSPKIAAWRDLRRDFARGAWRVDRVGADDVAAGFDVAWLEVSTRSWLAATAPRWLWPCGAEPSGECEEDSARHLSSPESARCTHIASAASRVRA